jgi:molybdopterin/thiamine biosynthesis adenylyltransferase
MDLSVPESRYDRQERITWWDQSRLADGRVLVVGAGALGNEIVKGLALLGVGHLDIVDLDHIERSNLARCVFFREADEGRAKADVVAEAAHALNPEVTVTAHTGSITAMGLGWLSRFDVVIAGLDNREARLWVNQACRKLGIPWVDGAIEGLQGVARVFLGEGPCYECTLGEADRRILAARKSCALLSAAEMASGKVPTTATSASVIAGIEVQEAVKLLVGRPDLLALRNEGLMFVGETLETYRVSYGEDPFCPAHDRYDKLIPWPDGTAASLTDLAADAADHIGPLVAFDLEDDLVVGRRCPGCGHADAPLRPLHTFRAGDGECAACGGHLQFDAHLTLDPADPLAALPLSRLGMGEWDVVTARSATGRRHYLLRSSS